MTDSRLLLDQNIEPEVRHRLENYGHTAEHVLTHDTLQRGDSDWKLAAYSLEHEVVILTYDSDFGEAFDESDYWGVLAISDDSWSAKQVADVVHTILDFYDEQSLRQFNPVGREWL
jgi:predicted nuclease of predicted toxin-antitoxin system